MSAAATNAAAGNARRARLAGLYAITPQLDDTSALLAAVEAALRGGAGAIQYRAKSTSPARREAQARALVRACARAGALLIVNDDAALAARIGADGVHIGRDDGDVHAARAVVGPDALIGVSCYDDLARARALVAQGADYVAFGSLFASTVKPQAVRAPLELLSGAATLRVPIVGIGGIDATNAARVIEAGASAVAVISAVFDADDIEAAARRIVAICDAAVRRRPSVAPSLPSRP